MGLGCLRGSGRIREPCLLALQGLISFTRNRNPDVGREGESKSVKRDRVRRSSFEESATIVQDGPWESNTVCTNRNALSRSHS